MIKNLILSGGAFKSCAHIGCIKYLEEEGAMEYIDTFIGTSAGSLVGFLLCLGYKSDELVKAIQELLEVQAECPPDIENILDIYNTLGVSNGELISIFVTRTLSKRFGRNFDGNISFRDFAKLTGKNFIVYASKLPKLINEYFSVDTTPDVDIRDAMRASCALPFIFIPVEINGSLYIDSGITNNFPHDFVKNNKLKDTIGIHIRGSQEDNVKMSADLNIVKLLRMILDGMMRKLNDSHGAPPECIKVIQIVLPGTDGFDLHFDMDTCTFKLPENKIKCYIDFGYSRIKEEFEVVKPLDLMCFSEPPNVEVQPTSP